MQNGNSALNLSKDFSSADTSRAIMYYNMLKIVILIFYCCDAIRKEFYC